MYVRYKNGIRIFMRELNVTFLLFAIRRELSVVKQRLLRDTHVYVTKFISIPLL